MKRNILNKYLNKKKELNTTKKILAKLREKPKIVTDFAKDYKTGYPHNVKIEGYDVITHYKIEMYEEKKKRQKYIRKKTKEIQKLKMIINHLKILLILLTKIASKKKLKKIKL